MNSARTGPVMGVVFSDGVGDRRRHLTDPPRSVATRSACQPTQTSVKPWFSRIRRLGSGRRGGDVVESGVESVAAIDDLQQHASIALVQVHPVFESRRGSYTRPSHSNCAAASAMSWISALSGSADRPRHRRCRQLLVRADVPKLAFANTGVGPVRRFFVIRASALGTRLAAGSAKDYGD